MSVKVQGSYHDINSNSENRTHPFLSSWIEGIKMSLQSFDAKPKLIIYFTILRVFFLTKRLAQAALHDGTGFSGSARLDACSTGVHRRILFKPVSSPSIFWRRKSFHVVVKVEWWKDKPKEREGWKRPYVDKKSRRWYWVVQRRTDWKRDS